MTIPNRYPGPLLDISKEIDRMKYLQDGEDFHDKIERLSSSMSDNEEHRESLMEVFGNMRFLPAGRVQNAMGSQRITTAFNCFVSGTIEDSMTSIMEKASEAAETMRRGGGIGYSFDNIRPRGDHIKSLDSYASGPLSFMEIFNSVCKTISSSGHRRGAQMSVLRVDHPDIREFIRAKRDNNTLTAFNISVGVTDAFMVALDLEDDSFDLVFGGKVYETVSARELWDEIMESTWDWAEPGVLFLDRINEMNNLWYCEEIAATNPCGEQALPPYGACLLGSFNLVKYLYKVNSGDECYSFNFAELKRDIPHVVRAIDNVIDRTIYPLKEQEDEAKNKRRMGLGITGLANAGELCGLPYGSPKFLQWAEKVFTCLRDHTYRASARLAAEKGPFPLYHEDYLKSNFIRTLPASIKKEIREHGIRNSHLTSYAPTGTISLASDNVSSGLEPTFSRSYERTIQSLDGPRVELVQDYAHARGCTVRAADELTVQEHLGVLILASHYVDSACSKTCNVGSEVEFSEFKEVYKDAWANGCKGITTFRSSGKRYGILKAVESEKKTDGEAEGSNQENGTAPEACYIDPTTGIRSCE